MGFNFGAFAGGLAQGGVSTYQMMEALESQKLRDELIKNQLEEQKAVKAASAETLGRIGQDNIQGDIAKETGVGPAQVKALAADSGDADFDRAVAQSDSRTMRENAAYNARGDVQDRLQALADYNQANPDAKKAAAGLPTTGEQRAALNPTLDKYTKEQAIQDFAQRLYAINPERAQAMEKGGYELKALQRSDKFDSDFDAERAAWQKRTADLHSGLTDAYAKDGANGVVSAYGKQLKDITGQDVAVKGDQVVLSKGGKTVDSFNVKELPAKMEAAMKNYYTHDFAEHLVSKGMFKTPTDAINYWTKKEEIDVAKRGVAVKEAVAPSEIARNYGAANYYNGGGKSGGGRSSLYDQAKQMVADKEAKDVESAIQILKKGAVRDAVEEQWNKERVALQNQGINGADMAQKRQEFMAEKGFAPQAAEATLRSGFGPDGKTPATQADIDKFNRQFPHSAVDPTEVKGFKVAKPDTDSGKKTEEKPKEAIPKNSRTGGAANPYVDNKGRPLPNPPKEGAAAPITKLPGALGRASAAVNDIRTRRIQDKIDAGLPLDPVEEARAKQAGLLD